MTLKTTLTFAFACALAACVNLLATPVSATTWNLCCLVDNIGAGLLTPTQPFTADGITITAQGFSSVAALNAGTPNVNLFGKNLAGDEFGLGLQNDPTGEDEIQGTSLVHIAMAAGLTGVSFIMDSVTGNDAWEVWGSNSATALGAPIAFGNDEHVSHTLPTFAFYTFGAQFFSDASGNVLVQSISAVPGPIVGAGLPGLVAACGALLALVRRRRRQVA